MQPIWAANVFGDHEDPRRRLQVLFGGELPRSGQPPAPALDWAHEQLAGQPGATGASAVRILRRAERRLTLKAATFLAVHATRR